MLNSKQFYTFPVRNGNGGMRFVNIKNIASIEDLNPGLRVILNVTGKDGKFETFDVDLLFGTTTGQIVGMDDDLHK